jgi:hypothetical protein
MANPSGVLSRLSQHGQMLKRLDKVFKASVPIPLNQHCHVVNFRETTLVVHTDSSLWATRLRYMTPSLMHQWQHDGTMPAIDQVLVKVRPSFKC